MWSERRVGVRCIVWLGLLVETIEVSANNVAFFVTVSMQNRPINQLRFGKNEKLSFPVRLHEEDIAVDNAVDLPTGHLAHYDIDILGSRTVVAGETSQNVEFLSRG